MEPTGARRPFDRQNMTVETPRVRVATSVPRAMAALTASKARPFVVVTGSLYLVGEALERLGLSPAKPGERGLNEWIAQKMSR